MIMNRIVLLMIHPPTNKHEVLKGKRYLKPGPIAITV